MTKKDYELIARALKNGWLATPPSFKGYEVDPYECYRIVVDRMANALGQDNPRFNKTIFYDACGVSQDTVEV